MRDGSCRTVLNLIRAYTPKYFPVEYHIDGRHGKIAQGGYEKNQAVELHRDAVMLRGEVSMSTTILLYLLYFVQQCCAGCKPKWERPREIESNIFSENETLSDSDLDHEVWEFSGPRDQIPQST